MNICILKESLCIGGTERSAANTSKALSKDHNVWIALYDASKIEYTYAGNVVDFRSPPKPSVVGKVVNTYIRDLQIRRLIKKNKIDVLYTFTGIGNRQTRYRYDVAKIISARDFGGLCERHNEYKLALKNSDAMICNSEYTKSYYLSRYPEDRHKVFSVYNYINAEEIDGQSKENVEDGYSEFLKNHASALVSVGRFCKEKGFEFLIEAFAKARSVSDGVGLVLIGDGDYKSRYTELISKYGLQDHVYFTGFQNNPYKYMTRCSCFVLSSLSEGFPNVLAEAMALGLPVIAANCHSGPAEILRNDHDYGAVTDAFAECDYGIITPNITETNNENAIIQLSKAINALLRDKEKMAYYSKKSTERAAEFSEDAARTRLNEIFNTLLERRKNSDKNKRRT